MKNWTRIFLVCLVLVGGTAFFAYQSLNQFNNALNNLSASYFANTLTVSSSFKKDADLASPLASTSLEISGEFATSTNPQLSFTFPPKDTGVYIGCAYPISWQSSTTIISLETVLADAGTREFVRPTASGLAKQNTIEKDLQNLNWKVGNVWPGAYYIRVSKINGVEAEFRSKVFEINKMPKGFDEKEKESICHKFSD